MEMQPSALKTYLKDILHFIAPLNETSFKYIRKVNKEVDSLAMYARTMSSNYDSEWRKRNRRSGTSVDLAYQAVQVRI